MADTAKLIGECPHCGNEIEVNQVWGRGGVNDGGYVLECEECRKPFDFPVGRDIGMSNVVKGARVLETYDEAVVGSKKAALKRHGIRK